MRRLTILLAALGALLLVSAAPALASELELKETFGSAAQPSFTYESGMAVDPANGDLLVIDLEEQTLSRFKPDGEADPFSALSGSNAIDGKGGADKVTSGPEEILSTEQHDPSEAEVAVAPPGSAGGTAGDIYVTDAFNERIVVFASSGAYLGQKSIGYDCGVATGPSGEVYVGDFYEGVHKLIPSAPATFSEAGSSPFGAVSVPCQVAAGSGPSAGYVFAASYDGAVSKLDAGTGVEKYVAYSGQSFGISVDPKHGYLYVAGSNEGNSLLSAINASGASPAVVSSTGFGAGVFSGVAVDGPSGNVYASRTFTGSGHDHNVEIYANSNTGPTNRATLTITKSAGGIGGIGTVKSKPKGINCATACESAVASLYKGASVTLTAKPANGSSFVEWTGACTGSSPTCTVPMAADEAVEAVFGGTSKAIAIPTALTVSKGESSGTGAVKGTGLACEAECTETTVLYQGPITSPKPKPAKTVVLSQTPAFGSEFDGWSGCDSVSEGKCTVTMEAAKEVTAEYTAKPNVALTLNKGGTGTGTVTAKPKGIKCATTCTTEAMAVPSGEAVVLKAKAASGMTFTGWSGGGCSGAAETCTVNPSSATTVTATFTGSPKPILSPTELTLNKEGSGTVKGSGIACEALCTTGTSIYQGTITEPKPKAAKTVVLEAFPAAGYEAVEWAGCDSIEAGKCVVTMEAAKEVTATFPEVE